VRGLGQGTESALKLVLKLKPSKATDSRRTPEVRVLFIKQKSVIRLAIGPSLILSGHTPVLVFLPMRLTAGRGQRRVIWV
jgi:hypothetical protein